VIEKPPPVLGNARVLEYAIVDETVTYSGQSGTSVHRPLVTLDRSRRRNPRSDEVPRRGLGRRTVFFKMIREERG